MAKQKTTQEICKELRELVEQIQSWNGSSGDEEKLWRANLQTLLLILSENPLDVYPLDLQLKEEIKAMVATYLHWSFNGYW